MRKAAEALGLELVEDCQTFNYYGGMTDRCIHKLRLKDAPAGAYEIGLRYADGSQTSYQPAWDTYGQHGAALVKAAGKDMVEFKKRYAAELSAQELRKRGYRVAITQQDQRLRVRATK
jgi:hypothetical protein